MMAAIQAFLPDQGIQQKVGGHRQGTLDRLAFPLDTGVPGLNLSFTRATWCRMVSIHPATGTAGISSALCWKAVANLGKRDLETRDCAYFPEGVYYGPQVQKGAATMLVLQFPGASRNYYLTSAEIAETTAALKAAGGVFDKGVYRGRASDGRPQNKDGYEALWEAHQQRKLVYPEPRYADFVVMKPDHFAWLPDPCRPGLEVKRLGSFTEYGTSATLLRFRPGATIESDSLVAPELRYVLTGALSYSGQEYPAGSCLYLQASQPIGPIASPDGAELYVLTLPMFRAGADLAADAA